MQESTRLEKHKEFIKTACSINIQTKNTKSLTAAQSVAQRLLLLKDLSEAVQTSKDEMQAIALPMLADAAMLQSVLTAHTNGVEVKNISEVIEKTERWLTLADSYLLARGKEIKPNSVV